jgi:hypothetical protein
VGGRSAHLIVQSFVYCGHDSLGFPENIVIPKSQDTISARGQKFCACFIRSHATLLSVTAAVDFNDEPAIVARKIRELRPYRRLATKMGSFNLQIAQMPP